MIILGGLMKIEKYTKLKDNRYNVLIDNEEYKLYDDVIIKYELLRNKEIDDTLFKEIIKYNNKLEAYYKALRYITKKQRTEKEIRDYLVKDYSHKTTEETIEKLKETGYLNKELYLKCYLTDQVNLSNHGPNKIKKDLLKLGFSLEEIEDKLKEINNEVWLDKASKIVKKKISTNHSYSNSKLKEKVLYDLTSMGYYKEMIEDIIAKNDFSPSLDLISKEYNKAKVKLAKKYEGYELESKIVAKLLSKGFYYEDIKRIANK